MADAWGLLAKYPVRQPYPSEDEFFWLNPNVAGYAAPGGEVALNPHSPLPTESKMRVALNEATRHHMMDQGTLHKFPLTEGQREFFQSTSPGHYAKDPQMARHTVTARILSGDNSAGPYTPEQRMAADGVLWGLLMKRHSD
jgi:hypothetical protein